MLTGAVLGLSVAVPFGPGARCPWDAVIVARPARRSQPSPLPSGTGALKDELMVLTLPLLGCLLRAMVQGLSRALLASLGLGLLLRLTRP